MHNCSCSNEEKEESTHLFLFYCVTIQNRHCGLHFSQGLALVHSGVGVGTELTSSPVHWSPSYKKLSEMWYAALYTVHATVQRIISDITPLDGVYRTLGFTGSRQQDTAQDGARGGT